MSTVNSRLDISPSCYRLFNWQNHNSAACITIFACLLWPLFRCIVYYRAHTVLFTDRQSISASLASVRPVCVELVSNGRHQHNSWPVHHRGCLLYRLRHSTQYLSSGQTDLLVLYIWPPKRARFLGASHYIEQHDLDTIPQIELLRI